MHSRIDLTLKGLNMIHEGTHGIHGLDLLGRKVVMDDGAVLTLLCKRMQACVHLAIESPSLAAMARQLSDAIEALNEATRSTWCAADAAVLCNATPHRQAFGHTVMAWIWLDFARPSEEQFRNGSTRENFYRGKLACAQYFKSFELPHVLAWLAVVSNREQVSRQMDPEWF